MVIKISMCIVATEEHLMMQVRGVLVMTFRNIVIFDVDNSPSCHADNRKNNFLVLGEGTTDNIGGSVRITEKKFSINFNKGKTKKLLEFALSHINSHLHINRLHIRLFIIVYVLFINLYI